MANLFDLEDAWMSGSTAFKQAMVEFEMEFFEPQIITALALDVFMNQDIYLEGAEDNGETPDILRSEEEIPTGIATYNGGTPVPGVQPNIPVTEL